VPLKIPMAKITYEDSKGKFKITLRFFVEIRTTNT